MNTRQVLKALGLALILSACLMTSIHADQEQAVAIFPFSILASGPNEKIRQSLPLMLKEKLEEDGVRVLIVSEYDSPGKIDEISRWGYERFRKEGIRLGVDRIITGNIFISGSQISLDTSMHNTFDSQPPLAFFSQAESMGTLGAAISRLSRSLIGELFEMSIISAISVAGNQRVESDAILRSISSKRGDIASPKALSKDLTQVYKMGYFDDVTVKKTQLDQGLEILFEVKEKPSVRTIRFKNNHIYEDEELYDVVDTSTGSILNVYKINSDVEKLKRLYTDKNYHNCKIDYEIMSLKNNQADIVFTIEEGGKLKIESITFKGNTHFDDDDILDEMETSEKGFWSWITSSGELDETELANDAIRIESFYKNNGFINVKVSDPEIEFNPESISVSFKIKEGSQFKTGKVDITGDILTTREALLEVLESKESGIYNQELVRKDIITLTDMYSDKGYANVNVAPLIDKDNENQAVNITYKISQGNLVYFNRIIITGNSKTRDKVIRREMAVKEQGLYSKSGLQRSYRNLQYRDYFGSIEIEPVKTDEPDERNIEVNVTVKATGNVSFGGGFSSDDGGFFQLGLEERNLFGRGQTGRISAKLSGETILYTIGFTEPWLFDRPISAGFDLYKLEKEYDYYDKDSVGLTLRLGTRQFWDYVSLGINYNIEKFDIYDVNKTHTNVTEGNFLTSSLTPFIKYDSRNHPFLPTEGSMHSFSVEYAGEFLGGEIDYTKFLAETGMWRSLFWKFTLALHAEAGYLDDRTNGSIDIDWERFYLGGINSIRGFDNTDINVSELGDPIQRGGEQYLLFNVEMIFPLSSDIGLYGVLFYDRGDVYRSSDNIDLGTQYSSTGLEVRWSSPLGPIRIAYGIVVEGQDVKSSGDGQFDFSVGAFF